MNDPAGTLGLGNEDGLRLLGLSRIPRCAACPRLAALWTTHENRLPVLASLPPAPPTCTHRVCAPLINRFGLSAVAPTPGRHTDFLRRRANNRPDHVASTAQIL
jgi:hypothetical protein